MTINTDILERNFLAFSDFIKNQDGQPFKTFADSKFIDNRENYKYSVYNEARENLGNKWWKPEDIGTGKIQKAVSSAIQTRVNHNYQMVDNNLVDWSKGQGIEFVYIQPGKPTQNAYVERFNGSFRDGVLDAYSFNTLDDLRAQAAYWMEDYNHHRPHESCKNLPPVSCARKYLKSDT